MGLSIDDKSYQVKLIGLMLVRQNFLENYSDVIEPGWFEQRELKVVAASVIEFFEKYRKPPSYKELRFYLKQYKCRDKKQVREYKELVRLIKKSSKEGGLDFVADHFQDFVSMKAYSAAIMASLQALEDRDYNLIPEIIRKAETASRESYNGLEYFKGVLSRLSTQTIRQVIPFDIPELDTALGGGHARQELTVVIAPPNRGKTLTLCNFGYAAMRHGHYVAHFHAEQTSQLIGSRYDARILNQQVDHVRKKPKRHSRLLRQFRKKYGGRLQIVDCAGWTVGKIRSFLYRMDQAPDVVIIDYADELVSARTYSDFRHEITTIYSELIRLGKEFNCSILTASQTNRGGLSKQVITMADVDEEFGKMKKADNAIALCQTDKEFKSGDIRMFLAKARNEESGKTIHCKIFPKFMRIASRGSTLFGP